MSTAQEPTIALVHGLATSGARTWGETGWLDLLADAGRSTAVVDLPGHGIAADAFDPDTFVSLEQWVLDQLPPEPVDAIGFSLGARTLLGCAATDPGRFNRLVVAGVGRNLFHADPERGKRIGAAIAGDDTSDDPEAGYFDKLANAPDINREALIGIMSTPFPPINAERLGAITCPVLVVIGDNDFAGPADELVAALGDATLVTLRNTDHFATPKNFDFIDAGLNFLGAAPI